MPTTSTVDVSTPDGTADAILVTADGPGPHPGVLLYMDAFGPRPRLAEMAGRMAEQGYTVLVPNVFHRHGRAPLLDLSGLADPDQRHALFGTLGPWIRELTPTMLASDNAAYLDHLLALDDVTGPVGVVGYCFGGAAALRSAAQRPEDVAAVAAFHPARLATDDPDSPHLLADRFRAEVYVGSADQDPGMPPEMQQRLDDALTAAGVEHTCEQYDGALHGWTMADTHVYDEAATERHWDALLGLFARRLGG
ncbi:dienelactone hydrolase family protein [Nocardioides iriomotensis]|uniref:Dienelactone hydrolase family protein n=1 Tax=Nocardioides iriomotensis TaxID=715784 RepID=A0A4Q5JB29_9ACTN|nr:dienelactone hydrolase family protein [Nocardioides iriomotensis]RYU15248.1 dienelactone hydrolase family protein [Nocardioides iriomotensis]